MASPGRRKVGFLFHYLSNFLKGALVGLVIILPGMSGGTMILMLGLYEDLMNDMAKLKIWRQLPFALGLGVGLVMSGWLFAWVFSTYAFILLGFLLGCVLASVRTVIGDQRKPSISRVVALFAGTVFGLLLSGTASPIIGEAEPASVPILMLGAAISSALMVLPGVPGNTVLYMMGIFDDIMLALATLDWPILIVYGIGAVLGMVGLSNLLNRLYMRHRAFLSWLFAGLIIGSAKMLIPQSPSSWPLFLILVVVGFVLTWGWENHSKARLEKKKAAKMAAFVPEDVAKGNLP